MEIEDTLSAVRTSACIPVQGKVIDGWPDRDNSSRVQGEQRCEIAAPRLVQIEAGADLQGSGIDQFLLAHL